MPPDDIFVRNRLWAAQRLEAEPDYFRRMAASQTPAYLWFGCADSRVPPNVIAGLGPGEVFVHRNIANIVSTADMNAMSVMQYAVEHLHVKHIIVCGHYGCGGVKAAMGPQEHGLVDHWLAPIRQLAAEAADALGALDTPKSREDRLCELNVQAQVRSVCASPILERARARGERIAVHRWIYGLDDGLLRNLGCECAGAPDAGAGR